MKRVIILILISLYTITGLSALTISEAQKMLEIIDDQSNFTGIDFAAVMTFIVEDPEKGIEKNVVQQFRRDSDDKFLLLFWNLLLKRDRAILKKKIIYGFMILKVGSSLIHL